jgi:transposase
MTTDHDAEVAIGDTAYDNDTIRGHLANQGMEAVIPTYLRRTAPADYDTHRSKERHLVECFINKINQYRWSFSRIEKRARQYLSFLQCASVLIWLR